jgi:type I restriction enzyme S subunit
MTAALRSAAPLVPLSDFAELKIGRTPARAHAPYWVRGTYPWVSIGDMKNGHLDSTKETISDAALDDCFGGRLAPAGTLLLSFKLTIGKVAILDVPATHNEAIVGIYFDDALADRDYLFYCLQYIDLTRDLDTYVKGKTLNKAKLRRTLVPLPSLAEQRRISRVLSTIERARDLADAAAQAAARLKDSLLTHLVTGDYPEVPLSDLVDGSRPICYGIVQPGPAARDGVPYVNVVDIRDGGVLVGQLKRTSRAIDAKHSRSRLMPGDVIVTIRGTHDRVAQVPPSLREANVSRGCARIVSGGVVPARFMYHWLQSPRAQAFLADHFRGVALRQVNIGDLNRMPVATPSFDEAARIAQRLDAAECLSAALRGKVAATQRVFKSAMQSLLGG